MEKFSAGEYVIYENGSTFELGRIKRIADDGAFVYYHEGQTASKTPFDHLHKLVNSYVISQTTIATV